MVPSYRDSFLFENIRTFVLLRTYMDLLLERQRKLKHVVGVLAKNAIGAMIWYTFTIH
jgi:hypothetical protein